jgi:hypothetical protein
MTPASLGFTPQRPVRWLNPRELARSAVAVVLADIFGAYSDKRELQQVGVFEQGTFDHGEADELWLDYVADVGDGFDPTYSVASLIGQSELKVDGAPAPLPRASVLVLGGDEVYPVANTAAYEERTTRVYAAALPVAPRPQPTLYAIPGNHDWYDGLTAFLRVFAQQQSIGGWETAQRRSYFALRLPHRWWLLAVDIQLDTYIDQPQLAYFRAVAADLKPGDGVILCTAKPSWYSPDGGASLRRLAYFVEHIVVPTGAAVRLVLSGDAHHYVRYTSPATGQTLLTAGIGGAYTSATHDLRDRLELPVPLEGDAGAGAGSATYDRGPETWPPRGASRRMGWGVLRLPFRNLGFWGVLGGVHAAFVTALLTGNVLWTAALTLLMLGGAVGFAHPERSGLGASLRYGLPHGLAHVALGTAAFWACAALPEGWVRWAGVAGVFVVAGFLAAELTGVYLLLAGFRRANLNELFAAQSLVDHKGFVRLHLGPDGALRVYPVGLETVCRRWRADPGGAPVDPWLVPLDPLEPRLIEEPFTVTRSPAPAGVRRGALGARPRRTRRGPRA